MDRLGTAVEELIEICLSEGKVIPALNLGELHSVVWTVLWIQKIFFYSDPE
jgi:hypothetical protein